jgi:hypothetical protein
MDTPEFIAAVGSITSKPLKHRLGLLLENKISCCGLRKSQNPGFSVETIG